VGERSYERSDSLFAAKVKVANHKSSQRLTLQVERADHVLVRILEGRLLNARIGGGRGPIAPVGAASRFT
jgi:hypothetical protein